jgi:hypothetical protein
MLCPRCYGKHVVLMNGSRIPCPECAGVGELHCCDGLREQEECPLFASRPTRPTLVENPARETTRAAS